jgi:hypothetical protein
LQSVNSAPCSLTETPAQPESILSWRMLKSSSVKFQISWAFL